MRSRWSGTGVLAGWIPRVDVRRTLPVGMAGVSPRPRLSTTHDGQELCGRNHTSLTSVRRYCDANYLDSGHRGLRSDGTHLCCRGARSHFPPPAVDFAVTDDGPYTRHDGGTDQAIAHCGNAATNPAADSGPNDGDVDSNDGGNRRQGQRAHGRHRPHQPEHRRRRLERLLPDRSGRRLDGLGLLDRRRHDVDWTRPCPATRSTTLPRAAFHRSRGARTPATRWWRSTTTAGSSPAASPSTERCRRTARCSSRPTAPTRVRPARPGSCPRTTCAPSSSTRQAPRR